jgi:cytochrome b561
VDAIKMRLQNTQQQWGLVSVSLHWFSVLVVFGLFALGLWMVDLTYYDSWYKKAPFIHKSIGILLFVLTILRLLWRWFTITPVALVNHTTLERLAAQISHMLLYVLLFAIMLSGYLISTADGRAIDLFGWLEIPAIFYGHEQQEDIAGIIHLWLAVTLISLVAIHAAAAIKHHFVDKDRTLLRMFGQ